MRVDWGQLENSPGLGMKGNRGVEESLRDKNR